MISDARVILWGTDVGAVSWLGDREIGVFQYAPEFVPSGIQLAPLMMPLGLFPFEFPALGRDSFKGLPGMLADSLPDKFGNAVIDAWLSTQGRSAASFNPVERLCYIGTRGMGALEFQPAIRGSATGDSVIELERLVDLVNRILDERTSVRGILDREEDAVAMNDILRVGTSAGGARAKAILAWNPETNEFRSGQTSIEPGFEHWLLKFDGVTGSHDPEMMSPKGYGRIEYAYYLMAVEAGIEMMECRLHHEGRRSHFMTRRFDRTPDGDKLHMQSLGAMAHFDYRQPAGYSYEQAIQVIRRLELPREDLEQMVLRAFFNVVARNCDDHVKNIAFLMDRKGVWRLAPAFDVTYAWNPRGEWTSRHQMSIGGLRHGFSRHELLEFALFADVKKAPAEAMLDRILEVTGRWPEFADRAGVEPERIEEVQRNQVRTI